MFGRGCDYVQPSSIVPQTEVSSASRLAALKGKFDSVLAAALNDHHDFLMREERNAQQLAERLARELVAEARLVVEVKKEAALKVKFASAPESWFESRPATLHSNQLLMARTMAASEKVADRKVYPVYRSKGVAAYPPSLQLSLPCVPSCISHAWCTDNDIPGSRLRSPSLADDASTAGDMSKDHDDDVGGIGVVPGGDGKSLAELQEALKIARLALYRQERNAQLLAERLSHGGHSRTADEGSLTRVASIFRAAFAQPSPAKDIGSHAGSPLASSSLQPKTAHSSQLLGSRALAASPNVVITDGDSWDTRVTAVGAVVETATVTITADMIELEETAESFGMGITWQSEDDVVLQAIPLSLGNNQTHSPLCASPLHSEVVNHSMEKGREILNSGELIEFTTSLKGSSPKGLRAVSSIQKSIDCKKSYQKKDDCWMNEISSVEKRVNFHFQSSKGNMRSGSGQQSSPNAGRREEYDEKEELKLVKSSSLR